MVSVLNMGPVAFRKYMDLKKIVIFGAGRALDSCIDLYFSNKEIELVVDNCEAMWGESFFHLGKRVYVGGINQFIETIKKQTVDDYILVINSPFYAADIIEQLDRIEEFNGLECVLLVVLRNTKERVPSFHFSKGVERIPRKIHYFWIGDKPIPHEFQRNIETWKTHNPDFEIICWNEKNYDFDKCAYTRECVATKQWSFATNYARLDVVYSEGGIYLDTDVVVKRGLDILLADKAFFNMGGADRINMGCGFGAQPHTNIIEDIKNQFEYIHFVNKDGAPMKKTFHSYVHPILKKHGFEIINQYQNIDGVALYPCEVMSPLTIEGMPDFFTKNTISIHMEKGTWKQSVEKEGMSKIARLIRERLMNDIDD